MAKKKKTAKKKVSKKRAKNNAPGRPAGSGNYIPTGLEVRTVQNLSRSTAVEPIENAYKRVVLETVEEDQAKRLYKLATLLQSPKTKKGKDLLKVLDSVR